MKTIDLDRRQLLEAIAATVTLSILPFGSFAQVAANKPKIGVIGSGNVGSNLGRSWARAGYQVMFSSLDIEVDRKLAAEVGANARAGTPQDAAAFGDVLLFAVPYSALPELGKSLGSSIKGKIVIDASNPFPKRDGAVADDALAKGPGIKTAELLPGARIVRAFNALGAAVMGAAHETPGRIGMPFASDDKEAIEIATRMIKDVGFEPVLVGGLAMGKYLMLGTPLAGVHAPDDVRKAAATLKP
ncbi:MAG: NAD(P)-binding domain-containing protein [Steroidobacteraceae bacterium]